MYSEGLTKNLNIFFGEHALKSQSFKVQQGDYNSNEVSCNQYMTDELGKSKLIDLTDMTVTVVFKREGGRPTPEYNADVDEENMGRVRFCIPQRIISKHGDAVLQIKIYGEDSLLNSVIVPFEIVESIRDCGHDDGCKPVTLHVLQKIDDALDEIEALRIEFDEANASTTERIDELEKTIAEIESSEIEIVNADTVSDFPVPGDENKLYKACKELKLYQWIEDEQAYVPMSSGSDGSVVADANFFDVEFLSDDADDIAAIARVTDGAIVQEGDVAVVRKKISDGVFSHTAYVYHDGNWCAMDGNYNAENVYFDEDLETTTAIGNITLTNGAGTVPAAGKNLKEVWEAIFVKEKNPVTTQPSVKITFSSGGEYEVGESVSTSYSISLDPGRYSYGPTTGVQVESVKVTDIYGNEKTTESGSFDDITVTDEMISKDEGGYAITAAVTYSAGAIPVTNRGNEYVAGQIKAGSKTATSSPIIGYRNTFWGTLESKQDEINSTLIRGLENKSGEAYAAGSKFDISVPIGAMRILFAYPATLQDVTSVIDENGLGAQIASSFAKNLKTVLVEGANGAQSIDYKVYYMDLSEANGADNVFHVTI